MKKVARQEKKFLLNSEQRLKSEIKIGRILKEDAHNDKTGYLVRSLYFDTLDDKDLFEKLAGVEIRRKIRLRIYDPAGDSAYLELKQKEGSNQMKRSLKVGRSDAERMIKGDYSTLLNYSDDFAAECYGIMMMNTYRPKIIVEYDRKAFVEPENSTRITFDSMIRATAVCSSFFDKEPHYIPVLTPAASILEVKYNHFLLSYIKETLNSCDKSEMAVSKYLLARQQQVRI